MALPAAAQRLEAMPEHQPDPLIVFFFTDMPLGLGYATGVGLLLCVLWACFSYCRRVDVEGGLDKLERLGGRSIPLRRRGYEQVADSEQGAAFVRSPHAADGGSSSGDDAPVLGGLAFYRYLPAALLEHLKRCRAALRGAAGRLGGRRAAPGPGAPFGEDDDDDLGDRFGMGGLRGEAEDEEEAESLLRGASERQEDSRAESWASPARSASPPRPASRSPPRARRTRSARSPLDGGDEEDQAAVAALMKLRPAACDSVGDDEDTDETTAPLVGSERARLLSR